jgi:hypothetical protein
LENRPRVHAPGHPLAGKSREEARVAGWVPTPSARSHRLRIIIVNEAKVPPVGDGLTVFRDTHIRMSGKWYGLRIHPGPL